MSINCNGCDKCYSCLGTDRPDDTYCARCDVFGHAELSPTCARSALRNKAEDFAAWFLQRNSGRLDARGGEDS